MQGCRVIVAVLLLSASLFQAAAQASTAPVHVSTASPLPTPQTVTALGWHHIANTTSYGQLYVDNQRGRTLLLTGGNLGAYDLQVFNASGVLQATIPSVMPYNNDWMTPQAAIDSLTGFLYLLDWHIDCFNTNASYADLYVVDPGNALFRHNWTYPLGLVSLAVSGGHVYAGHATYTTHLQGGTYYGCNEVPDGNITVINGTDGSIERTIVLPAGYIEKSPPGFVAMPLGVDPSGRWLFVPHANGSTSTTYRINVTDGTYRTLGVGGNYAFSPDGRRVYVCDAYRLDLWAYGLGNGTVVGRGSCGGPMSVNPVTGAIASDGSGLVTLTGVPAAYAPVLSYVAWRPDGRALLGLAASTFSAELGSWDGPPTATATQTLLNPRWDPLRVSFVSVGGVDRSSMQFVIDGISFTSFATWPYLVQALVNLSALPDGVHVLRLTGQDLVGQPLDYTWTFQTDGTPPEISITSSNQTASMPFIVSGRLNDTLPSWVRVNGELAPLIGTYWSLSVQLRIGDNPITVEARDALDNVANLTTHVWYWPPHTGNVTNAADHIAMDLPPGWVGEANASLGEVNLSLLIVGPADGNTAATVMVSTMPLPDAQETPAYVWNVAWRQRELMANLGAAVLLDPWNDTVDGRPAATFRMQTTLGVETAISEETVVVSAAWHRAYLITLSVDALQWYQYASTRTWLFQGIHIESAPPVSPPAITVSEFWNLTTASIVIAAVGVAGAVIIWRSRRIPRL